VRSAAQVRRPTNTWYLQRGIKIHTKLRGPVELTTCRANIGVTQAARTILDVRNISFYSQQRARDDIDTLEVCSQKLIQSPPSAADICLEHALTLFAPALRHDASSR
jgi:hypothetical protein